MTMPATYLFRVQGYLDSNWSDWFCGLTIASEPSGDTLLYGLVQDQAALHGILVKLQQLNLELIALNRVDAGADSSKATPMFPTSV